MLSQTFRNRKRNYNGIKSPGHSLTHKTFESLRNCCGTGGIKHTPGQTVTQKPPNSGGSVNPLHVGSPHTTWTLMVFLWQRAPVCFIPCSYVSNPAIRCTRNLLVISHDTEVQGKGKTRKALYIFCTAGSSEKCTTFVVQKNEIHFQNAETCSVTTPPPHTPSKIQYRLHTQRY